MVPVRTLDEHGAFTIAVASGKGGTGKTLVSVNLSVCAATSGLRVTLVDCDVEAPNDHLFLRRAGEVSAPAEVPIAEVDPALCNACGACRDSCAFGAVRVLGRSALVFDELCHGCGLCTDVCPTGAIQETPKRVGEVLMGSVRGHPRLSLVTGRLDIGQVKPPSVIRAARGEAEAHGADLVVLDAPPGVACSAVAATCGADVLLLVTEPTAFGLHDLELSVRLGRELGIPMAVLVNRDNGDRGAVEAVAGKWDVPILARIPFGRRIAEVYARGGLVGEELPEMGEIISLLPAALRRVAAGEAMVT